MSEIGGDLGLALRYRSVLWRDMMPALESGHLDVVCTAATISADRATRVAFSAPYLDIQLALVARAGAAVRAVDDLKGRHVGVRVTTTAAEYVWKQVPARRITLFDMNADVYAAVASGEVDAAVDDSPIAPWFVRTPPNLTLASLIPDTNAQYALVLARGNAALRTAVNDALSRNSS